MASIAATPQMRSSLWSVRRTSVVQKTSGTFGKPRPSMRVYCAQEVPRSVHARITPARITGAVLAAMLAFTGPVFADGDVLTDELPKVEEELSSITNPEEQESAAEELGALESEATLADEQIQKGGLLDDAPNSSIKDQLEALKSAFGLQ